MSETPGPIYALAGLARSVRVWLFLLVLVAISANPSPTPAPTGSNVLYIPLALGGVAPFRGMAPYYRSCTNLAVLHAEWWHGWDESNRLSCANFIPMVAQMQLPSLCYPALLVGNEPDGSPPSGYLMSVSAAVEAVLSIQAMCPSTYLIVGNVVGPNTGWLAAFLPTYEARAGHPFEGAIGGHAYCWSVADNCLADFRQYAAFGWPFWITETNVFLAKPGEMRRLLAGARASGAARVACYTNRLPANDPWKSRQTELLNADGTLTAMGAEFSTWGNGQ